MEATQITATTIATQDHIDEKLDDLILDYQCHDDDCEEVPQPGVKKHVMPTARSASIIVPEPVAPIAPPVPNMAEKGIVLQCELEDATLCGRSDHVVKHLPTP